MNCSGNRSYRSYRSSVRGAICARCTRLPREENMNIYNPQQQSSRSPLIYTYIFFLFRFKSSGGWVKIKLNLPHFHVPDTIHVFHFNPTLPATTPRTVAIGSVSMSTRPNIASHKSLVNAVSFHMYARVVITPPHVSSFFFCGTADKPNWHVTRPAILRPRFTFKRRVHKKEKRAYRKWRAGFQIPGRMPSKRLPRSKAFVLARLFGIPAAADVVRREEEGGQGYGCFQNISELLSIMLY